MLHCNDPECFALQRPVFPMGRDRAMHIIYCHGGGKIVQAPEQIELDPDGSVGLAIIDRTLKFAEDFDKLLGGKPPYKARFREPYFKMREECVADCRAISQAAFEKACRKSTEGSGTSPISS